MYIRVSLHVSIAVHRCDDRTLSCYTRSPRPSSFYYYMLIVHLASGYSRLPVSFRQKITKPRTCKSHTRNSKTFTSYVYFNHFLAYRVVLQNTEKEANFVPRSGDRRTKTKNLSASELCSGLVIAIPSHFESSGISGLFCQISGNSGIFPGISLYSIILFQNCRRPAKDRRF